MQQTEVTQNDFSSLSAEDTHGLYPPVELLEKRTKPGKYRYVLIVLAWLLAILFLVAASIESGRIFEAFIIQMLEVCVILVFAFACGWMHIILHEAGHMIAGLLSGMRLLILCAGRWRFERTVQGFRLRKAAAIAGIGGFALMAPDVTCVRSFPRLDRGFYFLGGIAVNLVCAAVTLVAVYGLSLPWLFNMFLYAFGGTALFTGVVNLVPFKVQNWRTDGLQIVDVLRHKEDQMHHNTSHLAGLSLAGVRARQWPQELIPDEQMVNDETQPFFTRISAQNARLIYALDCDDGKMAQSCVVWLVKHFHQIPDGFRQTVAVSIANYAAQMCGDKDLLAAWRPWCDGGLTDTGAVCHWLDAELAWLNGDALKARKYIQQAQAAMSTVMSRVDQQMLEESLSSLQLRMRGGHQEICHTGS